MKNVSVNFNAVVGKMKPHHAINNAPINNNMFHYLKDASIPYSRLHDTGGPYGGFRYVDIENIFRNFDADVDDPASYDFAFTDWLLKNICEQGTEPFFRLGATIEVAHRINAYRIFPPKDNMKWAQICEHIIRHYNHGWANGFAFGIKYWEIWNEPDNEPLIEDNPMWKGTKEQYFELYKTTSRYLKEKYPYIKIGGYASSGFYDVYESEYGKSLIPENRTKNFVEFFHAFLQYITSEENKSPIDFFSWHNYQINELAVLSARYVRENLDRYGLTEVESILNEWNPGTKRRGTEADACYIADMILRLHREPVDVLCYYDGQVNGSYQGLFDPVKFDIFPAYYAIHAFGELYRMGNEAETKMDEKCLPLVAATDGERGKILIANKEEEPMELAITLEGGWKISKLRVLQGTDGLVETTPCVGDTLTVPASKIVMLECEKA